MHEFLTNQSQWTLLAVFHRNDVDEVVHFIWPLEDAEDNRVLLHEDCHKVCTTGKPLLDDESQERNEWRDVRTK